MAKKFLMASSFPHAATSTSEAYAAAVLRRLRRFADLSERETACVLALGPVEIVKAGDALPRVNDLLAARFVVSGWAYRAAVLADGRRQIVGFLLPGDSVGVAFSGSPLNTAEVRALTPLRIVDPRPLFDANGDMLARALASIAAEDESLLFNQVIRLGRLTAYERVIHLLLELHERLALVGLADGETFDFPVTQEVLGDALGLSVVHVNRMLQRLRRDRLIERHRGRVVLLDEGRLSANCGFEARRLTYA